MSRTCAAVKHIVRSPMSFVRSQGFADLAVIQVPEAQPKMQNDNEEFLDVCSFVYVKDSLLPQVEGYMKDLSRPVGPLGIDGYPPTRVCFDMFAVGITCRTTLLHFVNMQREL